MKNTQKTSHNQAVTSRINAFFQRFHIATHAYRAGMRKDAGVPVGSILIQLFSLPFLAKNMYTYFQQEGMHFQKDVAYLMLRTPTISWRNFLQKVADTVLQCLYSLSSNQHQGVLIVDDSLLKVKVGQFYGIELEDFPCQIAQAGMWLMDHQMNMRAADQFGAYYVRLPGCVPFPQGLVACPLP